MKGFFDKTDYIGNVELERKYLLRDEDEETYDEPSFNGVRKNEPAIIAKENLLPFPFKPEISSRYPENWKTIPFYQLFDLVKATAYVLKKRYDFAPGTRVGIIANTLPFTQLMIYALWNLRCVVVTFPPRLGNDVKQYWVKHCDIKMIFYDVNFRLYDDYEKNEKLNKQGQWIWKWIHPLTEEDEGLCAGKEGVKMCFIYSDELCKEIYQAKAEGKAYQRKGDPDDVLLVMGTSSSSQAIIKNGQCTKMKFVPWQFKQCVDKYKQFLTPQNRLYTDLFVNIPFHQSFGAICALSYCVTGASGLIFKTQQLSDIGFVPEMILDDMAETKAQSVCHFPFQYAEYKKLFDENHPRKKIWADYFREDHEHKVFKTGGAPLNPVVAKWYKDTFDILIMNGLGSTEGGHVLHDIMEGEILPGEEGYYMRVPWVDFYFKPLNDDDPTIGELYTHSSANVTGYFGRAKPGEFYDSPVPGMRCDVGKEDLFVDIDGVPYFKTNDVLKRSPKSGYYKYVTRIDSIITFATGLKMNPLPFENTINFECTNIKHCCLILDSTQTEVVCFVEPNWEEIIVDGKPFDTSIDPSTLDRSTIKSLSKIAQEQTWNSIFKVLMDDSKSLTSWAKQLTIHNVYIIDYGKKFPSTDKGSLSRRVARLQYSNVVKYISKVISGEISEIPDEEVVEKENDESINVSYSGKDIDKILSMEKEQNKSTVTENENVTYEEEESNKETKTREEINDEIQDAIKLIYQSIKEIIPSTPEFESFNPESPFTIYGIDSLSTIKLTNVLSRKLNKHYSPAILFNYGNTFELAKFLSGNVDQKNVSEIRESIPASLNEKQSNGKIAIIGMGLRLPGAINSAKSLWLALAKGKDCVLPPIKTRDLHRNYVNKPSDQLDPTEHNIPRLGLYDTRNSVAKPSQFDAKFFNCLPDEALALDPRHRWILETSWEALENAGIPPNSLENSSTGVFVGINDDHEYSDLLTECGVKSPIAAHGQSPSGIAGRLSYFYRLYGPSFTMDTACSTGASALHTACRSLQCGDCDLSIVSGVKFMYSSKDFYMTCSARMTSPHGRCATFDKDADGFVPGEGCVTFILKRLEDAVRDNDHILSVVLSTSSGQSGLRQSISAPSSEGQAINMRKAMKFAGIKPEDVSYVEAHGTGTPLGDALEVHALNEIYGGSHTEENPLVVGSIKTNIGHTCETAGLAGIAKVIVSMQHKHIPRNLHFNTLNPEIDIKSIPIQIPTKTLPWNSTEPNKPLIAQVSSYGLQGSIVHVFLQEYIPENKEQGEAKEAETEVENDKENHVLTISAKTYSALIELCNNYMNVLEKMEEENEDVSDLCFSSNIGRQHFDEFRLSVSGKNASELYSNLEKELEKLENKMEEKEESNTTTTTHNAKKIKQMMSVIAEDKNAKIDEALYKLLLELFLSRPEFRKALLDCDSIISEVSNKTYSLVDDIVNGGKNNKEAADAFQAINVLSFYYALHKTLDKELDISKSIYCGYGLGELITILVNGGISLKKAIQFLKLVNEQQSIDAWYDEKEERTYKLNKNIYCFSQQQELKSRNVIPKEYYTSLYQYLSSKEEEETLKSLETMSSSIISQYGKSCKSISIYCHDIAMTNQLRESLEAKAAENDCQQLNEDTIISFFVDSCIDECEKRILPRFISNNYTAGNNVAWNEFHKRINSKNYKNYSYHKIDLPNYPFQRSTFWPKAITTK
ncbi:ketoacyl-synt-domain-containing protein [Neocallimastix californiae]|uniref:Ketoacyl-synt-domain-containing protein n=1 Tax=Neocallimastix californiae TaxID=1754190 RepID=A0A1Y2BRL0_9FUNG|nr:ketoacyl-synt-domain-containing protein [Neocallimastix californiae]|eukprot:ORY36775.1 ketoacyl-synt-domain-containing protein [Neocallimastix californiae]